ncbi:uncharacterized protein BJX67DRAFT_380208 [Aspergillus lucknowensis]|uniref:Uncharacterized protein n=1 Tax=Aspergillus lucknowensis TaxID=176173 RepID=A0ABR4LV46_9EURO
MQCMEKKLSLEKEGPPSLLTDLPRGVYFERYLYATQSQGSFLNCVHETLILSEPRRFVVASLQEILYQEAFIGSQNCLEIPGEQLFYLAQEKDHESSEATLKRARQSSPKRRTHLRIRIRAIAGVLALRAAASKTSAVVGTGETGDDWELGIPLRAPLQTQEKLVKGLTFVVHFLLFCLQMPSNLHIYLIWTDGNCDVSVLT